jgi:hypothetical protein
MLDNLVETSLGVQGIAVAVNKNGYRLDISGEERFEEASLRLVEFSIPQLLRVDYTYEPQERFNRKSFQVDYHLYVYYSDDQESRAKKVLQVSPAYNRYDSNPFNSKKEFPLLLDLEKRSPVMLPSNHQVGDIVKASWVEGFGTNGFWDID